MSVKDATSNKEAVPEQRKDQIKRRGEKGITLRYKEEATMNSRQILSAENQSWRIERE